MLSFFLKKKQSPDALPDEVIQGPSDSGANGADDFIFVEKKTNVDPPPHTSPYPMYPPMPSGFNGAFPFSPYPAGSQSTTLTSTNQTAVPYVQDVPFVLAPQLRIKDTSDLTQTQVDGILAMMTRQISVAESEEYNFALERSVQNDCY